MRCVLSFVGRVARLLPALALLLCACSAPADGPAALQPTATPAPLATVRPTGTPTPTPTNPPFTPTPVVVRSFSDFSTQTDTWILTDTEVSRTEILTDSYVVTLKAPDSYYVLRPRVVPGRNMRIAALVQPQGDARAGLMLRFNAAEQGVGSYYACWIDAGRLCGCLVSINDQWETIHEPAEHPALRPGEPNRLEFIAEGTQITLRANGVEVMSVENELLTDGVAGLYLENFKTPTGAIFDDIDIVVEAP